MRLISRMAVLGVPSSASRWISLSATISEVVRERPWRGVRSLLGEELARKRAGRIGKRADFVDCCISAFAELLQLDVVPGDGVSSDVMRRRSMRCSRIGVKSRQSSLRRTGTHMLVRALQHRCDTLEGDWDRDPAGLSSAGYQATG